MRMKNLLLLLLVFSVSFSVLEAQELSWRKHKKLAEGLEKEGDVFAAAENYRMAWEKKQKKEELIYKAAELYLSINDYRNAANAYQHVSPNFDEDKLILLKYARALKQDGQYDKSRKIFQDLKESYAGPDKAILSDIIDIELRGLDLTKNLAANMDRSMEILHPGVSINSDKEEFSPVVVGEDVIYFSSNIGGQARIFESKRQGQNWSKAETPAGFPVVDGGQYANGSMSPDNQRFYFTICNKDGDWNAFNTRCEIYVTKRSANGWTKPEALPDFINANGVNTTHPSVAHIAGQEFLFFSSNREGGRGGLDLWYVTRDLGVDNNDFTFPVNLGPTVNSLGDEVSPFYDAEESILYFSSNGHPAIGGFDVFKSAGGEVTWEQPMNLGLPINSSADDYGYVKNPSGYGGYFNSNRVFGGEKTNTHHQDVFEFSLGGRQIMLKANVYDQSSGDALNNVSVALYQLFDDGSENLLIEKDFASGSYLFELLPNRRFRVEVSRAGYNNGAYVFATDDPASFSYGQPLYLTAKDGGFVDNTNTTDTNTNDGGGFMNEVDGSSSTDYTNTDNGNTNPPVMVAEGEEYTERGTSAKDNVLYTSKAPRFDGTYYRIQVAALRSYVPTKFAALTQHGSVRTEDLVDKNMTRVLVGEYFSSSEAQTMLSAVQADFPGAFIVQYDNGVRYGRVNL